MWWVISGSGVQDIVIYAPDFSTALRKAKMVDERYSCGFSAEEDWEDEK